MGTDVTDEYVVLRDVAVRVATTAAARIRSRRPEVFPDGRPVEGAATTKSTETDPVTILDTEAEALLRSELSRLRPDERILGEEGGGDPEEVDGLRWVLDPIDGTVNFLYGLPTYAVSVGVQRDGVSVAGAVVDVPAGRVFAAARGAGATVDGVALHCTRVQRASMALVATGFAYDPARRAHQAQLLAQVLPRVRDVRRGGSAALDLCSVAAGWVDAYYEHGTNPWDWAAGALVAHEAGATVLLPDPGALGAAGQLLVASSPGVYDEILAML